jgi:hypothetical protein
MNRHYALATLAGLALAGIGCRGTGHIGGRSDCTHNPADAVIPALNNPYHPTATTAPVPMTATTAPATLPAVPMPN